MSKTSHILYTPKKEVSNKKMSPPKNKTVLQERFNRWDNKQNNSPPTPLSSHMQLGKHKAASSEDEVDKHVWQLWTPEAYHVQVDLVASHRLMSPVLYAILSTLQLPPAVYMVKKTHYFAHCWEGLKGPPAKLVTIDNSRFEQSCWFTDAIR